MTEAQLNRLIDSHHRLEKRASLDDEVHRKHFEALLGASAEGGAGEEPESVNIDPSQTPTTETSELPTQSDAPATAYEFLDPVELAQILHPNVQFHEWQEKIATQLSQANATQHNPHKLCLCACNGSGKDAFVIAPFVVWFMATRKNALVVVTSSSGVQLTSQTENYIARMCNAFNKAFNREAFKVIKRYIVCEDTGSQCRLFATDEAGKAEGYHPLEPGAEMAVIINECKSVPDEIIQALTRCTGYNYWLEVSTPGESRGHFYESWKIYKNKIRITSYDCPHKSVAEIEEDKMRYGESHALFRSKHLALFTHLDGQYVITQPKLEACVARCKSHIGEKAFGFRVSIDVALSNGGDETVCYVARGNKVIGSLFLRHENIQTIADEIVHFLSQQGVPKTCDAIFIDDGGVGRALWPLLQAKGYANVQRVLNQFRAFNTAEFGNRGAELWFNGMRLIEEALLLLPDDPILHTQITTRKYKRATTTGKILLESKADMKADGNKSPDRADAYFLLWHGLNVEAFHDALASGQAREVVQTKAARVIGADEIMVASPRKQHAYLDIEAIVNGLGDKQPRSSGRNILATIGTLSHYAH